MERFEQSMIKLGVQSSTIQHVKDSPIWRERIRYYTYEDMDIFIQIFPKLYASNVHSTFYSSPADFIKAQRQYVPMDLSN